MDKFSELKFLISSQLVKPFSDLEEKLEHDLTYLENLKNSFYLLDKSISELTSPPPPIMKSEEVERGSPEKVTKLEKINKDPKDIKDPKDAKDPKEPKERVFKKFNSTLNIDTSKRKDNHLNRSADLKEELMRAKVKENPVQKRNDKSGLNSSMDEKMLKNTRKDKTVYETKKSTRNNNNTSAMKNEEKVNNTLGGNFINHEDKEFLENVKSTQRNEIKIGLKKEGIEKLRKDLEKKTSKPLTRQRSKKALNNSADNIDGLASDRKKGKEKEKSKVKDKLPPTGKRELSMDKNVVPKNMGTHNAEKIGNKSVSITPAVVPSPKAKEKKQIVLKINSLIGQASFSNNFEKCLAIYSCSSFNSFKEKLELIFFNKKFSSKSIRDLLIKEIIQNYERKIAHLNSKLSPCFEDENVKDNVSKNFTPSKTAQNSLNFVKTLEEQELAKREQPEELIYLYRFIYLLIGENYESVQPQNQLLQNLITNIYPKHKAENLKSLFLNFVVKNVNNLSTQTTERIISLCEQNPKLFNSSEIIKYNKAMSFMCFIFKEIFDYLKQRTENGTLLVSLRKFYQAANFYQEKINILKKWI